MYFGKYLDIIGLEETINNSPRKLIKLLLQFILTTRNNDYVAAVKLNDSTMSYPTMDIKIHRDS